MAGLVAGCAVAAGPEGRGFLGAWEWGGDVGGLSGIEVSADGRDFRIISDREDIFEGRFARDAGRIVGVENMRRGRLSARWSGDTEGLAGDPGGPFAVSSEGGRPNVILFDADGSNPRPMGYPPIAQGTERNRLVEALAVDPEGRYLAIFEDLRPDQITVWRWDGGPWRGVFTLPRRDGYAAVGLDVDEAGRLYLLERRFLGVAFSSRVRRFAADGSGEEVLMESFPGRHDNLEGIAVWRDAGGRRILTMVSDDNFLDAQRTEIVEYAVAD